MRMLSKFEKLPSWSERAMQGLAFWIGHRHAYYRGYELSESAMVSELCNMLSANIHSEFRLRCEVMYRDMLPKKAMPKGFGDHIRADLVIDDPITKEISYVLEIKRAKATRELIEEDIERLVAIRSAHPKTRTFLVLLSEESRPTAYVTQEGKAITGPVHDGVPAAQVRVRRIWKASASFDSVDAANYVCLLEVFAVKQLKGKAH